MESGDWVSNSSFHCLGRSRTQALAMATSNHLISVIVTAPDPDIRNMSLNALLIASSQVSILAGNVDDLELLVRKLP